MEGCGIGALAEVLAEIEAEEQGGGSKQSMLSASQRLERCLARYRPLSISVALDNQDLPGPFLLLEAANVRRVGPGLELAPEAEPTDGLLDIVNVRPSDRRELLSYIDRQAREADDVPQLVTPQGRHVRIAGIGLTVHFDDETWTAAGPKESVAMEISIKHAAVELLLPTL